MATVREAKRRNALHQIVGDWLADSFDRAGDFGRALRMTLPVGAANLLAMPVRPIEVMLAKNPITVRRTKFVLNKGADLPLSGAMAFEVPIQPFASRIGRLATAGIEDFAKPETRAARRRLSKSFWQD